MRSIRDDRRVIGSTLCAFRAKPTLPVSPSKVIAALSPRPSSGIRASADRLYFLNNAGSKAVASNGSPINNAKRTEKIISAIRTARQSARSPRDSSGVESGLACGSSCSVASLWAVS
jgi:hypothetical protein